MVFILCFVAAESVEKLNEDAILRELTIQINHVPKVFLKKLVQKFYRTDKSI